MGVTEEKKRRIAKYTERLRRVILRICEIEIILEGCSDDLVNLYTEKRNLLVARENLEHNLDLEKKNPKY